MTITEAFKNWETLFNGEHYKEWIEEWNGKVYLYARLKFLKGAFEDGELIESPELLNKKRDILRLRLVASLIICFEQSQIKIEATEKFIKND